MSPTLYYAGYDETMGPIALFRVVADDDAESLDMEYMTADGKWQADPTVIDELHAPGVEMVDASDVPDIVDALTGGQAADAVANTEEDPEAETMPVPGAQPPKP